MGSWTVNTKLPHDKRQNTSLEMCSFCGIKRMVNQKHTEGIFMNEVWEEPLENRNRGQIDSTDISSGLIVCQNV